MDHYDKIVNQHGLPIPKNKEEISGYVPGASKYASWYGQKLNFNDFRGFAILNSKLIWTNDWIRTRTTTQSRALELSEGFIKSLIDNIIRFAVDDGIMFQSCSKDNADEINAFFNYWCQYFADITNCTSFKEYAGIVLRRYFVDGESANVWVNNGGVPSLKMVEPYLLYGTIDGNKKIISGVEHDGNFRPTNYYLSKEVNIHNYGNRFGIIHHSIMDDYAQKVPAKDFLLVYTPKYPAQLRGLSMLTAAILDAQDAEQIMEFEKAGIKLGSALGLIEETDESDTGDGMKKLDADGNPTDEIDYNKAVQHAIPGAFLRINKGDKISALDVKRPAMQMQEYMKFIYKKICASSGIPYEIAVDINAINGTSIRTVKSAAARTFKQFQDVLIDKFCNPVARKVLTWGIANGLVPEDAISAGFTWQKPDSLISIDAKKDAEADQILIEAGLSTWSGAIDKRGKNWKEHFNQRATEYVELRKIAAEAVKEINDPNVDIEKVLANMGVKPTEGENNAGNMEEKAEDAVNTINENNRNTDNDEYF